MSKNFSLAIHGGAGAVVFNDKEGRSKENYLAVLTEALEAGKRILFDNGTSIDAVEASIKILEDSPLYNAGRGSVLTHEGKTEMDAAIMNGQNLDCGAVSSVSHIQNPISAARLIMDKSPHILLTGQGSESFWLDNGYDLLEETFFQTDYRKEQLAKSIKEGSIQLDHTGDDDKKYGTVGAVALDNHNNLAAGTSTGGLTNKFPGRIGDSPIIGAGTYANNHTCAISATGHGECFIKLVCGHEISAQMEYGKKSLRQASHSVIHEKLVALKGKGGIIAIDRKGNIEMPFNTKTMFRGFIKDNQEAQVFV